MEITYENVAKWFDGYFEACNKNMGPLEAVPKLESILPQTLNSACILRLIG